jgi:hypothetical protein
MKLAQSEIQRSRSRIRYIRVSSKFIDRVFNSLSVTKQADVENIILSVIVTIIVRVV